MPDYKEMYLKMMRATEKAIKILVDAQRECEEMYINSNDEVFYLNLLDKDGDNKSS